jgi:putative endonuclease
MARPDRKWAESHGRRAETLASLYLRCKFYRVLGRRVRTPLGEIDLIARAPNGQLCFIEVKARAQHGMAAESLTPRQRDRIARAALLYLSARPALRHKGVRFDAILVAPGRLPRHLRDAWRPDELV